MKIQISYKIIFVSLVLVLVLGVYGCKKEDTSLKFDHMLHVMDNSLSCDSCHAKGKDGKLTNPGMDKCQECHEIDMDHPSEKCLQCHSVKAAANDYKTEGAIPEKPKGYRDLIFKHEAHEGVAECGTCHKGICGQNSLSQIEWPDMFVCNKCHNGKDVPIDCEMCHTEVRKEIKPESHNGDWAMHHGLESRFDRSCQFCHDNQERFCQDCHRTQKPKDHILSWKTSGHGEEATHDRRLCATCHTAAYCSDCHRSQKPISHARGNWMAYTRENGHAEEAKRNFRSCNVCHTTSECMQCHQTIALRRMK